MGSGFSLREPRNDTQSPALTASSTMSSARIISAWVTMRGGVSVSTLPMVVLKERPLSRARVEDGLGELGIRLPRGAVFHELDAEHQSAPAHVADRRQARRHFAHALERDRADAAGVLGQALLLDDQQQRGLAS